MDEAPSPDSHLSVDFSLSPYFGRRFTAALTRNGVMARVEITHVCINDMMIASSFDAILFPITAQFSWTLHHPMGPSVG